MTKIASRGGPALIWFSFSMGRTKEDWARFDHFSWVFDHSSRGSCHLKEGEQSLRAKKFLAMESVNSLRISAPPWWPLREGRDRKCEGRNEKCEFLARESVSSSPIVRIFGKGKCKFIANFSATMVTSLPSIPLSLCISLSLSLSPKKYLTHNIGSASIRASYNNICHGQSGKCLCRLWYRFGWVDKNAVVPIDRAIREWFEHRVSQGYQFFSDFSLQRASRPSVRKRFLQNLKPGTSNTGVASMRGK